MSTVIELAAPLTRQDTLALKHADKISFRLHEGRATLEATKDGKRTHDGYEQKHIVHCLGAMADYGREYTSVEKDDLHRYYAWHGAMSAQYDKTTRTLLTRLRPGDLVQLSWTRGNDNDAGRAVAFVRDELHILITNDKGKRETYLVAVQVGPDNTARMIRLAR